LGSILWFDPRREHSSIPTAKSRSRRAQGLSRLAASSRPPEGLGLDWPEHGGTLDRLGWRLPESAQRAALTLVILAPPPRQIQQQHTSARNTTEERVANRRQIQTVDFR
jgi:hypothetical protein